MGSTQISCGSGGDSALNLKKTHIRVESAIVEKNNSGNRTTMKKTLTAAVALSAIAGLAMAAIETAPAGYAETTGSSTAILVCNPFLTFEGTTGTTLGDIDGSNLDTADYIQVVGADGKSLKKAKWHDGHWYDFTENTLADSYALSRGISVRFVSTENKAILFSGVIGTANVPVPYSVKGNVFVGNPSAVAKTLGDFTFSTFKPDYDFVEINGVKYVLVSKKGVTKWVTQEAYRAGGSLASMADCGSLSIPSGAGVRFYNGKAKTSATVTLPGTLN